MRAVKDEVDRLKLRSRRRSTSSGRVMGGGVFDRGHIHHILTNPIYAGRIRHRDKTYEGEHPPIIDPDRWDSIQQSLLTGAARSRKKMQATRRSPLCGKLFDETGDRLTPSHSKTRAGLRLRYYISHRLVAKSGSPHPGAWRLPAEEFERKVFGLVQSILTNTGFAARLDPGAAADAIGRRAEALKMLVRDGDRAGLLKLVGRIDIAPGTLRLHLATNALASAIDVDLDKLDDASLNHSFPFELRKRGVETRVILANVLAETDETLIRNIAKANAWFDCIKTSETFAEIAATEGTSKRRVQQMMGVAFLAPDIVRDVLDGNQPLGFTSEWCLRHDLPSDWTAQRQLLATL